MTKGNRPRHISSSRSARAVILVVAVTYFVFYDYFEYWSEPPDTVQWKCEPKNGNRDPNKTIRPEGGVKVINITNSGEFVDRCEATEAWNDLICDQPRGTYRPDCKKEATEKPKLTILYIHGWKHSSDKDDSDHKSFTDLIEKLERIYEGKKNVLGIYIGWNASTPLLLGPLENLSFWSKKEIADRISQSGVVTKLVSGTGALSNSSRGKGDQFIAIGHSFGARLLFSAVGQSLIYEAEKAHPGYPGGQFKIMRGPADAVILLNPAFEASRYTSLDSLRRFREETFDPAQSPLLVSISTTGDQATRYAFPIGQWLGFRRGDRETTTLGNYPAFETHKLLPAKNGTCDDTSGPSIVNSFYSNGICLERTDFSKRNPKNNPFIIATTSPEIIRDHNDIWNENFSNWFSSFISALERRIDAASPTAPSVSGSIDSNKASQTPQFDVDISDKPNNR